MDGQKDKATGQGNIKKLFQYLKNSQTKEKTKKLNQRFQSMFTPLAPLSFQELSLMKVQDLVDDKVISPGALPEDLKNSTTLMLDIKISEAGILNLLKTLILKKAAGSDRIKPVILQGLRVELAPIVKVLFERSLGSGAVPLIRNSANVSPTFK